MTLRRRIAIGLVAAIVLGLAALAIAISRDAPCPAAVAVPAGVKRMQAVTQRCYGSTDVLQLGDVALPEIADGEVLVRIRAASVNPLDWHYLHGTPYFMRLGSGMGAPSDPRVGVDFAGVVEAVGKDVTRFKPGDEVFGGKSGALAQFIAVAESRNIVLKPANLTFEQAAAVPIAAITALQSIRDRGRLQAGQKVLINGSSGGVGTFAVQIAKALGADVTAVCSTRNAEMVRSLGADRVIDYTKEDFTRDSQRYDLVLDNVGNRSISDIRRVMKPGGTLVLVGGGGAEGDRWIGAMIRPVKAALMSPFIDEQIEMILADLNPQDLDTLANWMREGKVVPVIDRTYPLREFARAIEYLEEGHARGKVVVRVE